MRRDAVEPGQHGLSVAQRVAPTLRAQKRLLSQVLRLAGVAHDATDIAQDARVVLAERDLGRGLSYRERLRHSVDPTRIGKAHSSVVLGRSDRGLTARRARGARCKVPPHQPARIAGTPPVRRIPSAGHVVPPVVRIVEGGDWSVPPQRRWARSSRPARDRNRPAPDWSAAARRLGRRDPRRRPRHRGLHWTGERRHGLLSVVRRIGLVDCKADTGGPRRWSVMWWWAAGWWWPGFVLMAAFMVICLALMVRMMGSTEGVCGFGRRRSPRDTADAAERTLDDRPARGEIDIPD